MITVQETLQTVSQMGQYLFYFVLFQVKINVSNFKILFVFVGLKNPRRRTTILFIIQYIEDFLEVSERKSAT